MHGENFKIQAYEKIRIFRNKISGRFLQRQPLNLCKCARNAAMLLELPWTQHCITSAQLLDQAEYDMKNHADQEGAAHRSRRLDAYNTLRDLHIFIAYMYEGRVQ